METAYCPSCSQEVEIVLMTNGSGVDAVEAATCMSCGADVRSSAVRPAAMFARVALADDQEAILHAVRTDLLGYGLAEHVDTYTNGLSFIATIRASSAHGSPYDLAILDVHMDIMDGIKAATALRRLELEFQWVPIPILFFTSDLGSAELLQQLARLGPAFFMAKASVQSRRELPARLQSVLGAIHQNLQAPRRQAAARVNHAA